MIDTPLPDRPQATRGAVSNPTGRYEPTIREAVHDGWEYGWDEPAPRLRTTVTEEAARSILTRNTSPDVPFDRSVNLYRGCEHGCIYCFARPTHARFGLSPGLDFESRLFAKPEAPALLDKELRKKGYRPATIAFGTNTDPYQPIEAERGLMRACLDVLAAHRHPVSIVTKSALIRRDLDLLADMAAQNLAAVGVSLTTLDRDLCRSLEPRAAVPQARLKAIEALSAAGVPVTAMIAPLIPGLTDHELERLLASAAQAGAGRAAFILLRLPGEVEGLFLEWLAAHRPDRAGRIESLIRQCKGGHLNRTGFKDRFTGIGPYADQIRQRFRLACARLGLGTDCVRLRTDLFSPPPRPGDQLELL